MHCNYICPNHRIWLVNHPKQAIHCCFNASETGWLLYQEGRWGEALPYLGSAYETAEILLSSQVIDFSSALERFLSTLYSLTQAMHKLDRILDCSEVYQSAIRRLERETGSQNKGERINRVNKEITGLRLELNKVDSGQYIFKQTNNIYADVTNQFNKTLH